MKTLNCTENSSWEEMLRQGEQEEVLLMRNGRAVALLIPFDDDDLEWYLRERDPACLESLARARQQVREGLTVSHSDLQKELGIE